MLNLPGYQVLETIYQGSSNTIYQAIKEEDQTHVILKMPLGEHPSLTDIARLQHEYEILEFLNLEGILQPLGIEKFGNAVVLILEDVEGYSLKQWITNQEGNSLEEQLNLAIQLAQIIDDMHQHEVIHKDIKPSNIIINPGTKQIKLADFSIASQLTQEMTQLQPPERLEGSLSYMSPEQTGRMNQLVDWRTDLYSLGVTLYELFSGTLPFSSVDPLELIHCHLAKIPTPLHQVTSHIPEMVSNIVMKLLAKEPQTRYQSAHGLKIDLQKSLEQWLGQQSIKPFPLAQQDLSHRFHISQELYGRESEKDQLLGAFAQMNKHGTPEIVMVHGVSGVGKSRLIHEIHKPLTQQKGYFVSGKFDQLKRNIPYQALIPAFEQLVRHILADSGSGATKIKEELIETLGDNAQVMIEVIPEIELITGPQSPLIPLPSSESQHRFNRVFQHFVQVFSKQEHPLILFLDDLQWADLATLMFLELLITNSKIQYFLLIGAYRNNEVSPTHPLVYTLEKLSQHSINIKEVVLDSLNSKQVNQLLSDSLSVSPERTEALAQVTLEKTDGNPFFINQFLQTLYEAKRFTLNRTTGEWIWDMEAILQMEITDNVVELLIEKIRKLTPETQEFLQLASCVGNQFDLNTIHIISESPPSRILPHLREALQEALLFSQGYIYQDYGINPSSWDAKVMETYRYQFQHDRIQQAAYNLIPQDRKQTVHLKIGRLLWDAAQRKAISLNHIPPKGQKNDIETEGISEMLTVPKVGPRQSDHSEVIFDVVNHLNYAKGLIIKDSEKEQLAELNLIAGRQAKETAAYEEAISYLSIGMELLREDPWQTQYDLMLSLATTQMECEYLNANYEESETLFRLVIDNAKSKLEKAKVYSLQTLLHENLAQHKKALEVSLEALRMFGVKFSLNTGKLQVIRELIKMKWILRGKSFEDMLAFPKMTNPEQKAIINLLSNLGAAAYFYNSNLFATIALRIVSISARYGNIAESSTGYSAVGILIGSVLGDFKRGRAFGKLSFECNEKHGNNLFKGRLNNIFGALINHWLRPAKTSEPLLMEGYYLSLASGDLTYAGYNATSVIMGKVFQGDALEQVQEKLLPFREFVRQTEQKDVLQFFNTNQQMISELKEDAIPCSDEELSTLKEYIQTSEANPTGIYTYYFCQARIAYLFGGSQKALFMIEKAQIFVHQNFILGFLLSIEHHFYHSLILIKSYPQASFIQKQKYHLQIKKNQRKMKWWSDSCKENCHHKYWLVEAEWSRLLGQTKKAMLYYDQAIQSAQQHEYIQNEALANELAAQFYLEMDHETLAKPYLIAAHYAYLKWGATKKSKDLETRYLHLLSPVGSRRRSDDKLPSISNYQTKGREESTSSHTEILDLHSIIKASQTLSSEINLPRLLEQLMQIVIENAGAQKGILLLEYDGQWRIEASGIVDGVVERDSTFRPSAPQPSVIDNIAPEGESLLQAEVITQPSLPLDSLDQQNTLPISVIQYVIKTQENIVLNDATQEDPFNMDVYITSTQAKSILCFPLLHRKGQAEGRSVDGRSQEKQLNGILYLENNLSTGVFTKERLEVLGVLVPQIAISIENARMFEREQALSNLKDDFLAQTSHELRTPLHGMMGIAESMLEEKGKIESHQNQQNLSLIIASSQRLSHLIDDILDYSRIKNKDLILYQKPVSLRDIVQLVFTFTQPLIKEKPIELINAVPLELAPAYADEERLQQIFYNLIGNATKFTHSGKVKVKAVEEEGKLTIKVKDTGMGIAPEQINQIFDPFEQTHQSTKTHEGVGLGLAITKHLIELHQGIIEVDSKVDIGTCFTFTLPISTQPIAPKQTITNLSRESPSAILVKENENAVSSLPNEIDTLELASITHSPFEGHPTHHVLVVDDDLVNLKIVINHLTPQGYHLTTAINGMDALEVLEDDYPIDLIILDLMMPQMNGYETCQKIRQQYSPAELPIILLTAKNQTEDLTHGLQVGANDYLTKPFAKEELLARVKVHLQVRDAYHRLQENNQLRQEIQYRQQKEQQLEQSHQRLSQILNVIDDAVCAFSTQGDLTFVNQNAINFFEYPHETILEQSVVALFPEWSFQNAEKQMKFWKKIEGGKVALKRNLNLSACLRDQKQIQVIADVIFWGIDDSRPFSDNKLPESYEPEKSSEQGWVLTFTPSHMNSRETNFSFLRPQQDTQEKRLQQLEIAVESLISNQLTNHPKQEQPSEKPSISSSNLQVDLMDKLKDPKIRNSLFRLITDSVFCWEQVTEKNKVELAEESGIWKVSFEQRGIFRARTLERHLSTKSFPQKPRWREILKTAEYVLKKIPDEPQFKPNLEKHLHSLERQLMT